MLKVSQFQTASFQKRLIESHGLQCGFCTPGFVMSVFTLLRNNPTPTRNQLETAIEGNTCNSCDEKLLPPFSEYLNPLKPTPYHKKDNAKQRIVISIYLNCLH